MLTMNTYPHVFSPIRIGPLTFKNRLGFAPMVCNQCEIDGTVTDAMVDFIARQAATGAAYVTIGDTQVDDELGGAFMATLNIARSNSRPGLARLADAARYGGAVLSVELNHSGRGAKDRLIKGPAIAPSAIPFDNCAKHVRAMEDTDLERVKKLFVSAARRCTAMGFPMVMLHCAHNNLLGQFLSPLSNHRTDAYGGSPENRRRYPLEVLRAVREAVGPSVAIEVRVSADEETEGGLQFEESLAFMKEAQAYCDLIHISRGIVYNAAGVYTLPTYLRPRMLNVDYARRARAALDVPVAVVGNFSSLAEAETVIASGAADIVCMARAWLADPDLVVKSESGNPETVRPCLRCQRGCMDNSARGMAIHCAVNPSLGFEAELRALPPVSRKKRVLVAGGGPAGMTAAQTLVRRGHQVLLCEKEDHLGGLLTAAAAPSCKVYMKDYLQWIVRETLTCGAEIRLGTEVTEELVRAWNPDAVLVASGSEYLRPPIPGIDLSHVLMLEAADTHPDDLPDHVLICGGGSSGLETALSLARAGRRVTVADLLPLDRFAEGMVYFPRVDLMRCLAAAGVTLLPRHRILRFSEGGVWLRKEGEASGASPEFFFPAYACVIALGVKRRTDLLDRLRARYSSSCVIPIGDCEGGHNIYDATHTAFWAAMHL